MRLEGPEFAGPAFFQEGGGTAPGQFEVCGVTLSASEVPKAKRFVI